ncbi:MAG TPA: hypothetical protein VN828_05445, partial [Acidobacteriaceae bacterium]|nr:hypothetical protein [Acidobacteriaceae bacterium]
ALWWAALFATLSGRRSVSPPIHFFSDVLVGTDEGASAPMTRMLVTHAPAPFPLVGLCGWRGNTLFGIGDGCYRCGEFVAVVGFA